MRRILGSLTSLLLTLTGALVLGVGPASAHTDKDCPDFANQAAAQAYFVSLGGPSSDPDRLDADGDGVACQDLPCPCSFGSGGGGGGTAGAHRASVKLSIAKAPVGRHDWRLVCTVKRAGKPYAHKVVRFQWRDRNHRRWHSFVDGQTGKPSSTARTGPGGKARMRVAWDPPKGQVRCTTAADVRSRAGASRAMAVSPR